MWMGLPLLGPVEVMVGERSPSGLVNVQYTCTTAGGEFTVRRVRLGVDMVAGVSGVNGTRRCANADFRLGNRYLSQYYDGHDGVRVFDVFQVTEADPVFVVEFRLRKTAAGEHTCVGELVTMTGTGGDDVLFGDEGRDVIAAWGGNDLIGGQGGDDVICAGGGDDVVYGGTGNDSVLGGRGMDRLFGGDGDDVIYADGGDDLLAGRAGDDWLWGGVGDDTIFGGPGIDYAHGGRDTDRCRASETRLRCERTD